MKDEIWTMRDGTKIAVGDMDEGHVRNVLRMILRKHRRASEDRALSILHRFSDEPPERPDNHQILASLRARHGDAMEVRGKSVAGMGGGDVYVNGQWQGWYGAIGD